MRFLHPTGYWQTSLTFHATAIFFVIALALIALAADFA